MASKSRLSFHCSIDRCVSPIEKRETRNENKTLTTERSYHHYHHYQIGRQTDRQTECNAMHYTQCQYQLLEKERTEQKRTEQQKPFQYLSTLPPPLPAPSSIYLSISLYPYPYSYPYPYQYSYPYSYPHTYRYMIVKDLAPRAFTRVTLLSLSLLLLGF